MWNPEKPRTIIDAFNFYHKEWKKVRYFKVRFQNQTYFRDPNFIWNPKNPAQKLQDNLRLKKYLMLGVSTISKGKGPLFQGTFPKLDLFQVSKLHVEPRTIHFKSLNVVGQSMSQKIINAWSFNHDQRKEVHYSRVRFQNQTCFREPNFMWNPEKPSPKV